MQYHLKISSSGKVFNDTGEPFREDINKKKKEIASHVLVFLLRSVINPLKLTFANFATSNATSVQLFPLFWKAVGILEENCGVKVVGVTCDGA